MYSSAYVWAKVLGHMESRLTPQVVSTWFDDTEILELTDEKLVLYSPSSFRKDIILRRCVGYIKEAMQEIFQLNVVVLDDTEIEAYRGKSQKPEFIEFNPQFTFDNFVVGSSNRFAHAAAVSVANNPAETYNPLFIYGPSGLGKTHLLYAIASVVHKNHPSYNIVYIKGDQFTNEPCRRAGTMSSAINTAMPTCSSSTISSLSPARNRRRRNFSIPSITSTRTTTRSS